MDDERRAVPKATRLEDLAELAGVSISTVSRALNDSPAVNRRTKEHIWQLARKLDYPFRRSMPAGPIGAEGTVAVVIPKPQAREAETSDPFLLQLLAGITDATRERGCDLLLSHVAPTTFEELASAMTTSRADGVIFIGQSFLRSEFNRLVDEDNRFVVWGAEFPEQHYCSVGSDNPTGGRRATAHLLRLGRSRIVFLGDTQAPEASQRHRGYLDAHERAGVAVHDNLNVPAQFELESAETSMAGFIDEGHAFDGVFAASDLIAMGAIRALRRAGRRVPEDVSVIGYDNIPLSRVAQPALSTIAQDTVAAGRLLVAKLLDNRGGVSRSERLPTDLIVRESCGG